MSIKIKPIHPMPDGYSREQLIRCIQREVNMRKSVYPKWVASGKMTHDEAGRELGMMEELQKIAELTACQDYADMAVNAMLYELRKFARFDKLFDEIGHTDMRDVARVVSEKVKNTVYEQTDLEGHTGQLELFGKEEEEVDI